MSRVRAGLVLVSGGLLAGCLSMSGALWFEARGDIEMPRYRNAQVLILPVEVSPPYELDEGEGQTIQDQVKNNLTKVFGLRLVDSLSRVARDRVYPYDLDEIAQLAELYPAQGFVAISVHSVVRRSNYAAAEIGMRITFVDARDNGKNWTMARDYRSQAGFDAGSERFDNTVHADLRAVKRQLETRTGLVASLKSAATLRFLRGEPEKPQVRISSPDAADEELLHEVRTDQSVFRFRVQAKDTAGLMHTVVRNTSHPCETCTVRIEHTLARGMDALRRIDALVTIPLEVGRNVVEFTTTNQNGQPAVHTRVVDRQRNEAIYALGVGIGEYETYDPQSVPTQVLQERFATAKRKKDDGFTHFLANERATKREIELGLYELGEKTFRNEDGLGVFYFTGRVVERKSGVYIVAFDSDPGSVESTGVTVDVLRDWLPANGRVILDLCESDPGLQKRLHHLLPAAAISFDSCEADKRVIADRIQQRIDGGATVKDAVDAEFPRAPAS